MHIASCNNAFYFCIITLQTFKIMMTREEILSIEEYCAECEASVNFCTLTEYKQRMGNWWKDLDFITMEA